jgi:hypothetical protein
MDSGPCASHCGTWNVKPDTRLYQIVLPHHRHHAAAQSRVLEPMTIYGSLTRRRCVVPESMLQPSIIFGKSSGSWNLRSWREAASRAGIMLFHLALSRGALPSRTV